MDIAKNAMGYGAQSGQEPLSGQTGQGTANDPYDSGNIAGQSGAPASGATSTNPTGTTQYDTSVDDQTNTTGYGAESGRTGGSQLPTGDNSTKAQTSETLAAGVASGGSGGNRPLDTTSGSSTSNAADKGTDESRGPDEQVTSGNSSGHSRPTNDNNHNAQDTFFAKAGISADKPANPPKVASEVADKDPFASPSGGAASSNDANGKNSQLPPTTDDTTSGAGPGQGDISAGTGFSQGDSSAGTGLGRGGSSALDKGYKTADTEPHPQSSEVLSSATPGAALDSQYQSQTTGKGYENTTTASGSGYDQAATTGNVSRGGFDSQPQSQTLSGDDDGKTKTIGTVHDNDPSTGGSGINTTTAGGDRSYDSSTPATGNTGYDNPTSTDTTAAAAADDYPSPKTQPTESQGGLSGISHNTGSAPSAPDTGASLEAENPTTGAEGGKMKLGDKIKEKLHMGKK
ncbi:MAG: hypothetical protein Q9182_004031 [Xanthomendoza sp. 2 TL-2023]